MTITAQPHRAQNMRTVVLMLAASAILAACSGALDTKIDASSPEAYERSLKAIKAKLSPEDTRRFEDALDVVAFSEPVRRDTGLLGLLTGGSRSEERQGPILAKVDGRTPRQIIEEATQKKKARAEAELKSVTEEMAALEKKKVEAAKSAELLEKIVVTEARYYWSRNALLSQPVIDFKVTNKTNQALTHIFYHGTVTSPGRSTPWVDADFNNEIAGGLEPGETKHLTLSPSMFSDWGPPDTRGRDDLVLTVRVVNAEGRDKTKLATQFREEDAQRLEKLRSMKAELEKTLASR